MVYTNQSRFRWNRVADLFYNLSPNVTAEQRHLIQGHLSAVILDWRVDTTSYYNSEEHSIYARESYHSLLGFKQSYPKRVKNFLSLYFPNSYIPVGMLYAIDELDRFSSIRNNIQDADFCVIAASYQIPHQITLAPETFHQEISRTIQRNRDYFASKNVTLLVDVTEGIPGNTVNFWRTYDFGTFKEVMESLPYFATFAKNTITRIYGTNYLQFFTLMAMNYSTSVGLDMILGGNNPMINASEIMNLQRNLVHPMLKMSEETDPCVLKQVINDNKQRYESISLDLETWRAMARYQNELEISTGQCDDGHSRDTDASSRGTDVILYFEEKISQVWLTVSEPVIDLLINYREIHGMTLRVLMFYQEDLTQNNATVANFLTSLVIASSDLKIGCSVNYDFHLRGRQFQYSPTMHGDASEIFKREMAQLCKPVFEQVSVMIWKIWNIYDGYNGLKFPAGYHDIFITREIFMKEFPDKQVIIEIDSSDAIGVALSQIYGHSSQGQILLIPHTYN